MLAAVTLDPSAAPMLNVPAPYVAEFHVPMCVTATDPAVENVRAVEFVFALDAAAFHEHA
jgi:predicted secreted protein